MYDVDSSDVGMPLKRLPLVEKLKARNEDGKTRKLVRWVAHLKPDNEQMRSYVFLPSVFLLFRQKLFTVKIFGSNFTAHILSKLSTNDPHCSCMFKILILIILRVTFLFVLNKSVTRTLLTLSRPSTPSDLPNSFDFFVTFFLCYLCLLFTKFVYVNSFRCKEVVSLYHWIYRLLQIL